MSYTSSLQKTVSLEPESLVQLGGLHLRRLKFNSVKFLRKLSLSPLFAGTVVVISSLFFFVYLILSRPSTYLSGRLQKNDSSSFLYYSDYRTKSRGPKGS